jgi:hypothetical protein
MIVPATLVTVALLAGQPGAAPNGEPAIDMQPQTGGRWTAFHYSLHAPRGAAAYVFETSGPRPRFNCRERRQLLRSAEYTGRIRKGDWIGDGYGPAPYYGNCPGTYRVRLVFTRVARDEPGCDLSYVNAPNRCLRDRVIAHSEFTVRRWKRPPYVRVPNLVGGMRHYALCELAMRGLRWRYAGKERVYSNHACPDKRIPDPYYVTTQRPRPGKKVRTGKIVTLEVRCDEPAPPGEPDPCETFRWDQ